MKCLGFSSLVAKIRPQLETIISIEEMSLAPLHVHVTPFYFVRPRHPSCKFTFETMQWSRLAAISKATSEEMLPT